MDLIHNIRYERYRIDTRRITSNERNIESENTTESVRQSRANHTLSIRLTRTREYQQLDFSLRVK